MCILSEQGKGKRKGNFNSSESLFFVQPRETSHGGPQVLHWFRLENISLTQLPLNGGPINLSSWQLFVGLLLVFNWQWLLIRSGLKWHLYLLTSARHISTTPCCHTTMYQNTKHKMDMHACTHIYNHWYRNSNKILFMKGNACIGRAIKCSHSRAVHLISPERKERESNEKREDEAARVAECDGAIAMKVREERWRLVTAEFQRNRMMVSRGMQEHKPYSQCN